MSMPRIPGYSTDRPNSLADSWAPPPGNYPQEMWPQDILSQIVKDPVDWITISEHFNLSDQMGGRSAVIVNLQDVDIALESQTWIGRDLGQSHMWTDDLGNHRFENGLSRYERGIRVEFLAQARYQHDLGPRVFEVALPFLWYWDAIKSRDGWYYLNRAGRDEPLIKTILEDSNWKIQVRAIELRHYLAATGRALILQVDHRIWSKADNVRRYQDEQSSSWANFFWACDNASLGDHSSFSRLFGQYAVFGLDSTRHAPWYEHRSELEYPEFQYDIDPSSGSPLMHTCDPDRLGTYFDTDASRLHYLTPVYFDQEVLSRYTSDPVRYAVTENRLSCLDLWSVDLSINTTGLVEVYLGDIGTYIPSDEWPYWLTHNVAPEGTMREDRFRRDILNQWTVGRDQIGKLRLLRVKINDIGVSTLGGKLWRSLSEPDRTEFDRLYGPVVPDIRALNPSVMILTKTLVETLDKDVLRGYLGEKNNTRGSLLLLQDVIERLGGDGAVLEPLKALHNLRSRGGIAHLAASVRESAFKRMGIQDKDAPEAFEEIIERLLGTLGELDRLFTKASSVPGTSSPRPQ